VQVEDKAGDGKTKDEVRAPPAPPTTKSLLGDAYPDMMSMASTALDFWIKGKTEVRHKAALFVLMWNCAVFADPCCW